MRRLDEVAAESGPVQANRAQAYLRHVLGWLHEREIVAEIAIDRIKRRHREESRERVLSASETGAALQAVRTEPGLAGTAFAEIVELLFLTGMRRGEAAQLQGRDIDIENALLTVRAESRKMRGRGKCRSLRRALEIVKARASRCAKERLRLRGCDDRGGPFSGWGKSLARLRNVSGVVSEARNSGPCTTFRRTVATELIHAGIDALVVEDLLGHVSGARRGVAGVYNRASTMAAPARRPGGTWARAL